MVRQRGGQQSGQRPRLPGGRAGDFVQSGCGQVQRIRDLQDVGLGWGAELGQAAKPVEFASLGRRRGACRRRARRSGRAMMPPPLRSTGCAGGCADPVLLITLACLCPLAVLVAIG
jgi:hypothetical protein